MAVGKAIVGLFPALNAIGGVQASGRVAWQWITESVESGLLRDAQLLSYGKAVGNAPECRSHSRKVSSSRGGLAVQAICWRRPVDVFLVWHLSLLRLIPLFRLPLAKVVTVLHGIEAWRAPDMLTRALLRRVTLFISNSDYTWRRFLEVSPRCRAVPHQSVHLGISSAFWGGVSPPAVPAFALMLSRLDRREDYKGHRQMIDAWPLVLSRRPDAELWVAGDGDLLDDLKDEAVRRRCGGKVRFLGLLSDAEKERVISMSSCLALPSRGEGFGLVYLEAMRLGRPCLVSTLDAGREVVNPPEAGLMADLEKPSALADAVCRLLSPGPEWDAWSNRAKQRYEARFTARHFQERLSAALAPLL